MSTPNFLWIYSVILNIYLVLGSVRAIPVLHGKGPAIYITQERRVRCEDDPLPLVCDWESDNSCEDEGGFPSLKTSSPCYETIKTEFANETENTILCQPGDRLTLQCTSNYLIRWKTTILPTKEAKYSETRRYNHNPLKPDNDTFSNVFELVIGEGTSGWMRCEVIDLAALAFESMKSEFYIFSQDGSQLVGDAKEESVLLEDLNQHLLVPCVANYPHVEATLEQEIKLDMGHFDSSQTTEHFQYEPVDPKRIIGRYDPRHGFGVQGTNESGQTYRCVADYQTVLFYYKKFERMPDDEPDCTVNGEGQKDGLVLYTGSFDSKDGEKSLDIVCKLDRSHGIIFLKMIRCISPHECDWLSACFDKCWLNHDVEKQQVSQTSESPLLKNPYPTGIALCTFPQQSIVKRNYYFIGLDRLSYFISDSVPSNALIKAETNEQQFYTFQSTKFSCRISTFLLISNIKFAVMFKNKTKILLDVIDPNGDPDLEEFQELGFSQRAITVNLTTDMTTLFCMAPYYNSTEWLNSSISFDAKDVKLPTIDQSSENAERTIRQGEQLLPCSAKGDPKPVINWEFPNEVIARDLRNTKNLEGESILRFPKIHHSYAGTYRCTAVNQFSKTSFDFDVKIEDGTYSLGSIIGFVLTGIVFVLLLMGITYCIVHYHRAKKLLRDLTDDEINYFQHGCPISRPRCVDLLAGPEVAKCMAFDRTYTIQEKDLIIVKQSILGQGEYGMVYRGFWQGDAVAVKTTKPTADVSYVKALLVELKIMAYIGQHPHVVTFNGAMVSRIKERIVYVVVELCPFGNLHSHLRKISSDYFSTFDANNGSGGDSSLASKHKSLNFDNSLSKRTPVTNNGKDSSSYSIRNFIYWFSQIADGMEFLSRKKVIHGDLAARNILVFRNEILKITDFGLSRQMYGYSKYVKKQQAPLPWRWMAIESLRLLEFSSQSDVWSFAVTMWEIFTMGETPYPGQNWTFEFIDEVANGTRLGMPHNAPKYIYDLMLSCWNTNPSERPSFTVLKDYFESRLQSISHSKQDD